MMAVGAICLLIAFYLVTRLRRLSFIKSLGAPALTWLLPAAAVAGLALFLLLRHNVTTMAVVFLHLMLGFLITDFVFLFLPRGERQNLQCLIALSVTILYLGIGVFNAWHVYRTSYELTTEKALPKETLRIVEISDSHLGVTLTQGNIRKLVSRIQAENPDLVVIVGDYVDDDSLREDMIECSRALGTLKTTFGVYYVFGNHDNGYYSYRDFSAKELREQLTLNGIEILEDEALLLGGEKIPAAAKGESFETGGFYLVGRRDRSFRDRLSAAELTSELSEERYCIFLDHQPSDFENEALSGADLVLSGHTHGGHIFPAGLIGLLMKANDSVYGHERRGDTDFIVSSGVSGWAVPIKTGCFSEYVVVDVHQK